MNQELKEQIKALIKVHVQNGVTWKQENGVHYGEKHFNKRVRRGDIKQEWGWTFEDYDNHIVNIMSGIENDVHIYWLQHFEQRDFCFSDDEWIVMCGENGVMVSCFKGKPHNYFVNNPGYTYFGKVKDVLK